MDFLAGFLGGFFLLISLPCGLFGFMGFFESLKIRQSREERLYALKIMVVGGGVFFGILSVLSRWSFLATRLDGNDPKVEIAFWIGIVIGFIALVKTFIRPRHERI